VKRAVQFTLLVILVILWFGGYWLFGGEWVANIGLRNRVKYLEAVQTNQFAAKDRNNNCVIYQAAPGDDYEPAHK
jgi:hypothetical protein